MRFTDVKRVAERRGINTHRLDKREVVRAIQRASNSNECFGTNQVTACSHYSDCPWKNDCLILSGVQIRQA